MTGFCPSPLGAITLLKAPGDVDQAMLSPQFLGFSLLSAAAQRPWASRGQPRSPRQTRTAPDRKRPRAARPPNQWQPRRGLHCGSSRFALSAKRGGRGKLRQVLPAARKGQKAPGPFPDLLRARPRPHATTSGRVGVQHRLLFPLFPSLERGNKLVIPLCHRRRETDSAPFLTRIPTGRSTSWSTKKDWNSRCVPQKPSYLFLRNLPLFKKPISEGRGGKKFLDGLVLWNR